MMQKLKAKTAGYKPVKFGQVGRVNVEMFIVE